MMRKFILASLAVAAFSAVRADEVESDVTLGALRIEEKQARVIVSVPWCACSTNDSESIAVSNVIKTANLTAGSGSSDADMLYAIDGTSGSQYKSWYLKSTGTTGEAPYWAPTASVTSNGSGTNPDASTATVKRGDALILVRKNPTKDEEAIPFYVCGQVATNKATTTIAQGDEGTKTPAYTLLAPPVATNIALNGISWDSTKIESDDRVSVVGPMGVYINLSWFPNFGWGYVEAWRESGVRKVVTNTVDIVAGTGFWYISKYGTQVIDWSKLK